MGIAGIEETEEIGAAVEITEIVELEEITIKIVVEDEIGTIDREIFSLVELRGFSIKS